MSIRISGFSKNYGEEPVFKDFNLEIEDGEILEIEGATGIGKTTIVRAIAGLEEYEGKIETSGRISFLFQDQRILDWVNIRKNILLPIKLGEKEVDENHIERINRIAENLGVRKHLEEKPDAVSGGQMQRLLIIRALVNQPDILLLDEPFNSLDPETRKSTYRKLAELCREENITTIIASHQEDLSEIVDRTITLDNKTKGLE